jgi:hypothetical protein
MRINRRDAKKDAFLKRFSRRKYISPTHIEKIAVQNPPRENVRTDCANSQIVHRIIRIRTNMRCHSRVNDKNAIRAAKPKIAETWLGPKSADVDFRDSFMKKMFWFERIVVSARLANPITGPISAMNIFFKLPRFISNLSKNMVETVNSSGPERLNEIT